MSTSVKWSELKNTLTSISQEDKEKIALKVNIMGENLETEETTQQKKVVKTVTMS